jgi:hypothetical protein
MMVIKRFSRKLIIPNGVFAFPPTHAQFNFNLSKYTALNTDVIPKIPRIKAINTIEKGDAGSKKLNQINNSQKGYIKIHLLNLEEIKSYFLKLTPKPSISISFSIAKRQMDMPIKTWKFLINVMVIRNEVQNTANSGVKDFNFIFLTFKNRVTNTRWICLLNYS